MNRVLDYLEELYPNAKTELEFNKDYELLIAIVLSAQTTDKVVNKVTRVLFERYPSLEELDNASVHDIEAIIREIGTYKKKSIYIKDIVRRIRENNDVIPNNREFLSKLNGVGRKTINVFLSTIYNEPLIGVDTHVSRVSKRLGLVKNSDDILIIEEKLNKQILDDKKGKFHKQMVLFGRYKCKTIRPLCNDCKLKDICKK